MTNKNKHSEGFQIRFDSAILYCVAAALIGFVIKSESHQSIVNTRIEQLERRTDTLEQDLKSIKESLYEIRGDVKLLIKGKGL